MTSHHTSEVIEGSEVSVMSHITPVFEVIFSYSKMADFSGACGAES